MHMCRFILHARKFKYIYIYMHVHVHHFVEQILDLLSLQAMDKIGKLQGIKAALSSPSMIKPFTNVPKQSNHPCLVSQYLRLSSAPSSKSNKKSTQQQPGVARDLGIIR